MKQVQRHTSDEVEHLGAPAMTGVLQSQGHCFLKLPAPALASIGAVMFAGIGIGLPARKSLTPSGFGLVRSA
jgi:hypothetical protein